MQSVQFWIVSTSPFKYQYIDGKLIGMCCGWAVSKCAECAVLDYYTTT